MRHMTSIGYALSSEEHTPADLVRHAALAEQRGFRFALISDHFHPWTDRQGQSPFVWGVLGAIAQSTDRLVIGTGVTCPTMRIHPAIIAQAAATAASLLPERFFLGVGTGERLNEHVTGEAWPDWAVRAEMLEEAVGIIRELWTGELTTHHGRHFAVENARIYTLPPTLPPIHVASSGERMAGVAGRIGDGLIGTGPDKAVIAAYRDAGGRGPRFGQVTVCWGESAAGARKTAVEWWPTAAIHGNATQELALPQDFEDLARLVDEEDVAAVIPCGPEPQPILDAIAAYVDAGYDHVYVHQVGPDQEGFLDFASRSLLPEFAPEPAAAASSSR
jgi:coenzyme F420-dependent glucose-6-phosphate dehydrogenase